MNDILKSNRFNKLRTTALLTALAAPAVTSCANESPVYERDTTITSLQISDGANFREHPRTDNSADGEVTRLFEVKLSDYENYRTLPDTFKIDTPDGVAIKEDYNNGTWYGIDRTDALRVIASEDEAKAIQEDDDGIVWVNDDRAIPEMNN